MKLALCTLTPQVCIPVVSVRLVKKHKTAGLVPNGLAITMDTGQKVEVQFNHLPRVNEQTQRCRASTPVTKVHVFGFCPCSTCLCPCCPETASMTSSGGSAPTCRSVLHLCASDTKCWACLIWSSPGCVSGEREESESEAVPGGAQLSVDGECVSAGASVGGGVALTEQVVMSDVKEPSLASVFHHVGVTRTPIPELCPNGEFW